MPEVHGWAAWLEHTELAVWIRQDLWLYPILEIVHIVGIVLLVGPAWMFDLRILGFAENISVVKLADHFLRWSRRGLFLILPSGLLLFITQAATLVANPVFWLKLSLIGLAGLNAWLFHRLVFTSVSSWDSHKATPVAAKMIALASLMLWVMVISCGRLLAY